MSMDNEMYSNVIEDNLKSAGACSEDPETVSEASQDQLPADFDIVQLRNGEFFQYFKEGKKAYVQLKWGHSRNFEEIIETHYTNDLIYKDILGVPIHEYDIMKIYRGIATSRVLTASASELKKYEVWSRIEPFVIPVTLIKAALQNFAGFEEEDIKVDEKNKFYVDGAIIGDSVRKFIENEEWKKQKVESS